MAFDLLSMKLKSDIPGPASKYGYVMKRTALKQVQYDGQLLPKFLLDQGVPPELMTTFLRMNRIGDVFTELQVGTPVILPKVDDFLQHPEA